MLGLIRNCGDIRAEFQATIASFEHKVDRPRCRRLMLNPAELREYGNKDHFPFGRDIIFRDLIQTLHPVVKPSRQCETCISIEAPLNDPPCEKRHGFIHSTWWAEQNANEPPQA